MSTQAETVKLQIRIPRCLHQQYVARATFEDRSLNGQIVYAMKRWMELQHMDAASDEPTQTRDTTRARPASDVNP